MSSKAPNSVHEHKHWVYTFSFLISQPRISFPYTNLYSPQFSNCSREAWGDATNWGLIIFLVLYFYSNCGNIQDLSLRNARVAHHYQQILCIKSNLNLRCLPLSYLDTNRASMQMWKQALWEIHPFIFFFCFKNIFVSALRISYKVFYSCFVLLPNLSRATLAKQLCILLLQSIGPTKTGIGHNDT